MQRFLDNNSSYAFQFPDEFSEEFSSLLQTQGKVTGSLSATLAESLDGISYTLPTKSQYCTFDFSDLDFLNTLFGKMYSVPSSAFTTNTVFQKYCSISFKNKTIGCSKSRTSCNLIARWDVEMYSKPPTTLAEPYFPSSLFRPINLHYFAKVTFTISEQRKSTIIAIISWYAPHPNQFTLGKPAEIIMVLKYI